VIVTTIDKHHRRTDRWTNCRVNTALRVALRDKNVSWCNHMHDAFILPCWTWPITTYSLTAAVTYTATVNCHSVFSGNA